MRSELNKFLLNFLTDNIAEAFKYLKSFSITATLSDLNKER